MCHILDCIKYNVQGKVYAFAGFAQIFGSQRSDNARIKFNLHFQCYQLQSQKALQSFGVQENFTEILSRRATEGSVNMWEVFSVLSLRCYTLNRVQITMVSGWVMHTPPIMHICRGQQLPCLEPGDLQWAPAHSEMQVGIQL